MPYPLAEVQFVGGPKHGETWACKQSDRTYYVSGKDRYSRRRLFLREMNAKVEAFVWQGVDNATAAWALLKLLKGET